MHDLCKIFTGSLQGIYGKVNTVEDVEDVQILQASCKFLARILQTGNGLKSDFFFKKINQIRFFDIYG